MLKHSALHLTAERHKVQKGGMFFTLTKEKHEVYNMYTRFSCKKGIAE